MLQMHPLRSYHSLALTMQQTSTLVVLVGSSQTLVGNQVFGQNQHIANSDNAQAEQDALNEQQNIDSNTAGGTAPTTQAIFGDNQKLGQTQAVSNSGWFKHTRLYHKPHAESK